MIRLLATIDIEITNRGEYLRAYGSDGGPVSLEEHEEGELLQISLDGCDIVEVAVKRGRHPRPKRLPPAGRQPDAGAR